MNTVPPAFEANDVRVRFRLGGGGWLNALDGVDLCVGPGEVVGIAGESGCGKTTFALSILGLHDRPEVTGRLIWRGRDLRTASERELQQIRGTDIAMIFQNAQGSLNPVRTVRQHLYDVIAVRPQREARARELLGQVGMTDIERNLASYPHELSGGMCQRVMIALALARRPALLVADEPTASLDVTIQAQIINLLHDLRRQTGMSILVISHDLAVLAELCDRIAIMYLGRVVEVGPTATVLGSPFHPYTKGLLRSLPRLNATDRSPLPVLVGEIGKREEGKGFCRFRDRCVDAFERCSEAEPSLRPADKSERLAACFLANGAEQ